MSIPDRLYRLAKGKIGEIRELFDNQDEEIDPELLARIQRAQSRKTAREELADALEGVPPANASPAPAASQARTASALRTPDQIRVGASGGATQSNVTPSTPDDRLAPHYRLLGLEPGSDYPTVQAVYEKLLSRCNPERFPAGSPEALEALDIKNRLEATYKVLREELDPTARRFEMLEL